jgi:hypothetical protein
MKNKKNHSKIGKTFSKIGLVDVTTKRQKNNGTLVFFDDVANCNYIFRQRSSPRVEYRSTKTNTIQTYKMFDSDGYDIKDDMNKAIPYILNRKIRGVKEKTTVVLRMASDILR